VSHAVARCGPETFLYAFRVGHCFHCTLAVATGFPACFLNPLASFLSMPNLPCTHQTAAILLRKLSSYTAGQLAQVTALWVTHRLEELDWADSVSYMDQGRILFSGPPDQAREYLRRLGAHV
jgi:hypothetical protein